MRIGTERADPSYDAPRMVALGRQHSSLVDQSIRRREGSYRDSTMLQDVSDGFGNLNKFLSSWVGYESIR
jgi:hypothetical protein